MDFVFFGYSTTSMWRQSIALELVSVTGGVEEERDPVNQAQVERVLATLVSLGYGSERMRPVRELERECHRLCTDENGVGLRTLPHYINRGLSQRICSASLPSCRRHADR